jgi:integrase
LVSEYSLTKVNKQFAIKQIYFGKFKSNQNTILSKQYVNRKLKELFGSKSLSVSTHSLRKTFGRQVWSNNNETDKALLYLSELFNHSSPAITKRYLGIRQEELDDIYMSL